ncbi:hypothetical protein [Pectobacterium versatile]|uniref:hypothetical protein n=1 Tax=Pectobacterium versatile TaxID=2488639 RepID=UPI001F1810D5|nr:hypothetical protein [Pectobacterium versatile]
MITFSILTLAILFTSLTVVFSFVIGFFFSEYFKRFGFLLTSVCLISLSALVHLSIKYSFNGFFQTIIIVFQQLSLVLFISSNMARYSMLLRKGKVSIEPNGDK